MRVTCGSNILICVGGLSLHLTQTMNCTFFETLSAAGTDTVFFPYVMQHTRSASEQYLNMQQLQVIPVV